jgi:hypothetical protein
MRIELDLPDWVDDGSAIRIFKGVELVAKKMLGKPWEIKTVRCDMCGECCTIDGPGWKDSTVEAREDGYCRELIPKSDEPGKFICRLGSGRPFSCSAYAAGPDDGEKCCIRWKTIKD